MRDSNNPYPNSEIYIPCVMRHSVTQVINYIQMFLPFIRCFFFPPTETAETVINDMLFITVIMTFCLPVMCLSSACVVIHLSLQSKALHHWIREKVKTGVRCRFEQVEGSLKSYDEVMLWREDSWLSVARFFTLSWASIWFDYLYLFILEHIYLIFLIQSKSTLKQKW